MQENLALNFDPVAMPDQSGGGLTAEFDLQSSASAYGGGSAVAGGSVGATTGEVPAGMGAEMPSGMPGEFPANAAFTASDYIFL
jgi:hypothetical protein